MKSIKDFVSRELTLMKKTFNLSLFNQTDFLVERKLSREDIKRRYDWIGLKQSQSNRVLNNEKNIIPHRVHFSDALDGLYCAKYSSDGETIATCYGSGCIQLRNGETGDLRHTIKSGLDSSAPVTCCRFHPYKKNILYASSACGSLFICNVENIEFWKFAEEIDNEINTIDIDSSAKHIVTAGKDSGLRIYDLDNGKLIQTFRREKFEYIADNTSKYHFMRVFCVKFHERDINMIISGGWDKTLQIWDMRVKHGSVGKIVGPYICGDAIDIQDTKILTGSWIAEQSLQIWDLRNAQLIKTIEPLNRTKSMTGEYLYSARYFDGDPYGEHVVIGGSGLNCVELISLKQNNIIACFDTEKTVMTIDTFKTNIVYGGTNSSITMILVISGTQ